MLEPHVGTLEKEYRPRELEDEVLNWWEKERIYEKTKALGLGGKKFYFLDGPPYVTNPPHVGTAWNKIIKDVVIRFKRMQGFDVHDRPGYDCHGLPIEVKVEEVLGLKTKKDIEEWIGVENFIKKCREFAETHEKIQTNVFKRLGVWMDWDRPYLTYLNDYIESAWWTLKKAHEKNLFDKGFRVVHWCPRCETALAGYEVTDEYRIVSDPSIYVKFPVKERPNEFILIWTTTPWTLPANMAVMVHPEYEYVRAKVRDSVLILAKARCEKVFSELGLEYEISEIVKGRDLYGLRYRHPLLEEVPVQSRFEDVHRVVLSEEYVTLEEGTGCVHTAPGHGEEDFEVGLEYNLPVFSPVDSTGKFTNESGKYANMHVKEANLMIIDDLRRKGLLLFSGTISHKYPHCWRCKSPLLLRATEQWFIRITKFKEKMLSENEQVFWVPEWAGSRRFKDWLLGARDWVISRQRYWGVPLPIWICESCGKREVIGSLDELKKKAISYTPAIELHKPWVDRILLRCSCGDTMRRIPDILDVWMDSGIASWASLNYPKEEEEFTKLWPADVIIEAHDQTRGWFYSQLGAGMVAFDRCPYNAVIMHGHALDERGRKMSKSLGNFIAPEDVIERYGADPLRFYELRCTLWEDFCFKWDDVRSSFATLNVLWHVYSFASMYMSLDKFNPSRWPLESLLLSLEDRWILSRFQSLVKSVTSLMNSYCIHDAARLMKEFLMEDLSHWYIRLIRRRVWMDKEDPSKLASYAALYEVLKGFLLLMAPFTPFITEAIYQRMVKSAEPSAPESVHMNRWPTLEEKWIDEGLERRMELAKSVVSAIYSIRQKAKLKLRWPVKTVIVAPSSDEVAEALSVFHGVIQSQGNCEELKVLKVGEEPMLPPEFLGETFPFGRLYVDTRRTIELLASSLAREVVRRSQLMRKEMSLRVDAFIELIILTSEKKTVDYLSSLSNYIMTEVRAKSLLITTKAEGEFPTKAYVKDWDIEGEKVSIGILEVK